MKRNNLILLLIAIAVFAIFITTNQFYIKQNENLYKFDAFMSTSNISGFDTNNSALYFGTVAPTTYSSRHINITAPEYPIRLQISSVGNISRFINSQDNNATFEAGESREIIINANVPKGTPLFQDYEGQIFIRVIPLNKKN